MIGFSIGMALLRITLTHVVQYFVHFEENEEKIKKSRLEWVRTDLQMPTFHAHVALSVYFLEFNKYSLNTTRDLLFADGIGFEPGQSLAMISLNANALSKSEVDRLLHFNVAIWSSDARNNKFQCDTTNIDIKQSNIDLPQILEILSESNGDQNSFRENVVNFSLGEQKIAFAICRSIYNKLKCEDLWSLKEKSHVFEEFEDSFCEVLGNYLVKPKKLPSKWYYGAFIQ